MLGRLRIRSFDSIGGHMERIVRLRAALARVVRERQGQGLAEYALILALIAIIAIIALIFLGGQISKIISDVGNSL
jgi:pilus assembly protein Flp/PilA